MRYYNKHLIIYYYLHQLDNYHEIFGELTAAGILVDYMDVLVQYQELVKEAKYREILIKRYKKWEIIRRRKKAYEESWMHEFLKTLKGDKNKREQGCQSPCSSHFTI